MQIRYKEGITHKLSLLIELKEIINDTNNRKQAKQKTSYKQG